MRFLKFSLLSFLCVVFLTETFNDANARNRQRREPKFKKARAAFYQYFMMSPFSTQVSRDLYQLAVETAPDDPLTKGGPVEWAMFFSENDQDYTEPLYRWEECLAFTHRIDRLCLVLHHDLVFASPLYNSWIVSHAMAELFARNLAQNAMNAAGVSPSTQFVFLDNIKNFQEVIQLGHLFAMWHWEEYVKNWETKSSQILNLYSNNPPTYFDFLHLTKTQVERDYLGRPKEHDYKYIPWRAEWQTKVNAQNEDEFLQYLLGLRTRERNDFFKAALRYQKVAIINDASPTDLYKNWTDTSDKDLSHYFSTYARKSFAGSFVSLTLNSPAYLKNKNFSRAATAILTAFAENKQKMLTYRKTQEEKEKFEDNEKKLTRLEKNILIQKAELEGWKNHVLGYQQLKADAEREKQDGNLRQANNLLRQAQRLQRELAKQARYLASKFEGLARSARSEQDLPLAAELTGIVNELRNWE